VLASSTISDRAALGDPPRPTARQWALLVALLGAAALIYALPLAERSLWSQDEARVALLAEDTLRHGPRLPARVRDEPYLNKPPLYFWSVALVSWPAGHVSEHTAPIPSVVAALATLLGVFAIGARLSGAPTGLVAVAVLGTSPGFFLHSHQVLPDMALTAWLTWALYFLLRALRADAPRPAHLAGFYACVAGALWIKGVPALLVLPASAAAVLAARGRRGFRELRPGYGLAFLALALLPWVIPYTMTPGHESSQASAATALTWYLDRHSRASSSIPLRGGFITFLPWTLWLVPAAVWWWRTPHRDTYRALAAWMLVEVVLLGLSVQQRSRYLLPLYPLFALLVAAAVTSPDARAQPLVPLHLAILAVLAAATAGAGAWLLLGPGPAGGTTPLDALLDVSHEGLLLVALFLAGLALAFRDLRAGGPPARALLWVAGALALVLLVEAWVYPVRLTRHQPIRAFAEAARPALDPHAPVLGHPDANLAFDLYLDHPVREVPQRAEILARLERPAAAALLLREADWKELRPLAHASWCPITRAEIRTRAYIFVGACR
jgi:4-amino-4-deoxy-L-arabinose transferase-like glycosyltransferase